MAHHWPPTPTMLAPLRTAGLSGAWKLATHRQWAPRAEPPQLESESTESEDSSPETPSQPVLLDPVETIKWGGTLPSRRRFIQGTLLAAAVALGGNLGGISSLLLGLDGGDLAGKLKLDVVVPVNGYKRCFDPEHGFEFQYPAQWLADQSIAQRSAARIEEANPLDPPSLRQRRISSTQNPVAAFGPAGTSGEENVSVVIAPIGPGFRLTDLGQPSEVGQQLLDKSIAPEGSGKVATLLGSSSRLDVDGNLYYSLEYTVKTEAWFRHNVSIYASRENRLYSLNAQCPEEKWAVDGKILENSASTFKLV